MMKPKKILFVSYYWPPYSGPALTRIMNFIKFLSAQGWEILVLTPESSNSRQYDESLLKEVPASVKVFKTTIYEPGKAPNKKGGAKGASDIFLDKNLSFKNKVKKFLRLNILIPDAKIAWIPFAVRMGKKIIDEHQPDLILSTAPPPSVNLIAKKLKAYSGLPWISDYRDPWTKIYYMQGQSQFPLSRKLNKHLEKTCLEQADVISMVNYGFFENEEAFKNKLFFLPNGFKKGDFTHNYQSNKKVIIRYLGRYKTNQYSEAFFEACLAIQDQLKTKINIEFIGGCSEEVRAKIEKNYSDLSITFINYVGRKEAYLLMQKASILFMVIGRAVNSKYAFSTKLFEYMASKRPILAQGPIDGSASKVLTDSNTGEMFTYTDQEGIKNYLLNLIQNPDNYHPKIEEINQFDFELNMEKFENRMLALTSS